MRWVNGKVAENDLFYYSLIIFYVLFYSFFCQTFLTISYIYFGLFTSGLITCLHLTLSPFLTPINFMYLIMTANLIRISNLLLYHYSPSFFWTNICHFGLSGFISKTFNMHWLSLWSPPPWADHPGHPREKLHIFIPAYKLLQSFTLCCWNKDEFALFVLRKSELASCLQVPPAKLLFTVMYLVSSDS